MKNCTLTQKNKLLTTILLLTALTISTNFKVQAAEVTFTASEINAGTTKNGVSVSTVGTKSVDQEMCLGKDTKLSVIQIASSANASFDNYYVQIASDNNISNVEMLAASASSSSSANGAAVYWINTASGTFNGKEELSYNNYRSGSCAVSLSHIPENTKTIRLYRCIRYLGSSFSGASGYAQLGGSSSMAIASITVTTAPSCTAPTTYNVSGTAAICAGSSASVSLSGSQSGVTYELYKDGVATGTTLGGNGSALDFTNITAAGAYTIRAQEAGDFCAAVMDGTATITVNPQPTITGATTVEANTPLTLTATPSGGEWSTSGGASITSGGVFTATAAGTYTVTYTASGCSATHEVTVTEPSCISPNLAWATSPANGIVTQTMNVSTTHLGDGSVTYNSDNAAVATIDPNTGVLTYVSKGSATITATLAEAGGYCGASINQSITVTCATPETKTISASASAVCSGESVSISVENSQSGVTYELFKAGTTTGKTIEGNGSTVTFAAETITSATEFTVKNTASGAYCEVTTIGSTTVTINAATAITTHPADVDIVNGGSATLTIAASGTGLSYQWYSNSTNSTSGGTPIDGGIGATSITVSPSSTTYYYCIVSGTCGSQTSNVATVSVCTPANTYTVTASTTTLCADSEVTISLTGSQSGVTYVLYKNDSPTTNTVVGTGASISFASEIPANADKYTVKSERSGDICAADMAGSQTITVYDPTITGNHTVSMGNTLQLTAATAGGAWSVDDGTKATIDTNTGLLTPIAEGTVNVTYTVSSCADTHTVTITTTPMLACGVLYKVEDIKPSGMTLTGSDKYVSGTSENGIFTTVGTGSGASDGSGLPSMATATQTISGVTFSAALYFKGAATISNNIPKGRAISFVVPDGGGSLEIYYRNGNNIRLIKEGETTPITVGSSGYAKNSVVLTSGGKYYMYATEGTTTLLGLQLTCPCPAVSIGTQPASATYRQNDVPTALSVSATGGTGHTYQWQQCTDASGEGASDISGETNSSYTPSTATVGATYYRCVVTNDCGSTATSDVATITVKVPCVAPTISGITNATVEQDQAATITVTATGTAPLRYQWQTCEADGSNAADIAGETHASLNPSTSTPGTTYYKCIVTNDCDQSVTSGVTYVTVTEPCPISITTDISNITICDGKSGELSVTATNVTNYQWYKDGAAIADSTAATLTVSEAGNYYCKLENTTSACSKNTATATVTLSSKPTITVQPVSATYTTEDTPAALSITATGDGPITYQWYKNGAPIAGETSNTYTPSIEALGTAYYRCDVTNGCGSTRGDVATITVTPALIEPTFTWYLDNATITSGVTIPTGGRFHLRAASSSTCEVTYSGVMEEGVSYDDHTNILTVDGSTTATSVTLTAHNATASETHKVGQSSIVMNIAKAGGDCETFVRFVTANDAASNGVTNSDRFGGSLSDGKDLTSSFTFDGVTYNATRRSSNGKFTFTFTVQNEKTATVCIVHTNAENPFLLDGSETSEMVSVTGGYSQTFTNVSAGSHTLLYNYSSNTGVVFLGLKECSSGGGCTEPTTLAWSDDTPDGANIGTFNIGSPNIIKTAVQTQTPQSMGALTYSSSNTAVATVNASTGEVDIIGAGDVTITASLAASGCFTAASISYSFKVNACTDAVAHIACSGGPTVCDIDGSRATLSLTGGEAGATIQWYRGGTELTAEANKTTIEVGIPGEYYAITTKNCAARTDNSIVLHGVDAPTVHTRHSTWSVKDGAEILVQVPLFEIGGQVPESGLVITTTPAEYASQISSLIALNAADSTMYLDGTPTLGNASKVDITVTLTATNECGASASANMTLSVRPVAGKALAYVVTRQSGGSKYGTGNFAEYNTTECDITAANSLPKYLSDNGYTVTGVNAYASTDKNTLWEYYSQFDVILITDYPNTKEKGGQSNGISYIDALACLIDKFPLLTMEAFVADLPNWRAKGVTGEKYDPDDEPRTMDVKCYAHGMFEGVAALQTAPDPDYDSTRKLVMLSNGYMQGYSAESAPNFIYIATITTGSKTIIACCERQEVVAARMMLLGLQNGAMNSITPQGKLAIKQMLDYLLIKDPLHVADCAMVFTDKTGDGKWSTEGNWYPSYDALPDAFQGVRIEKACTIDTDAKAASVKLRGDSINGCVDCDLEGHAHRTDPKASGHLTIATNGSLATGLVAHVKGKDFVTLYDPQASDIKIKADNTGMGAFAFTDTDTVRAEVEYYSKGAGVAFTGAGENRTITAEDQVAWQYMGIPLTGCNHAVDLYQGSWMCRWIEGSDGLGASWDWVEPKDPLAPFEGYAITQETPKTFTISGPVNGGSDHSWTLSKKNSGAYEGFNLLANSYTAPIQIDKMTFHSNDSVERTVYIFNSGTYAQWNDGSTDKTGTDLTAGNYLAIPIGLTGVTGLRVIPPMQGFFVYAKKAGAKITVPYHTAVYDNLHSSAPMRAPAARTESVLAISVSGKRYGDRVYLVSGNSMFTNEFDNGYDARKMMGIAAAPQLFVLTADGDRAVDAAPTADGRFLGFRAGEDTEYTIAFDTDEYGLYLHDLLLGKVVPIQTGGTYRFTADNNTNANKRFKISSLQTIAEGDKDQVLIYREGNLLVIENYTDSNGDVQLFDVQGRLIMTQPMSETVLKIPLAFLPPGVYVAQARTNTEVKSVKIIF